MRPTNHVTTTVILLSIVLGGCSEPNAEPICGNAIVETGEICDDGNTIDETTCEYGNPSCTTCSDSCTEVLELTGSYCGDGALDDEEMCDEGISSTCDQPCPPRPQAVAKLIACDENSTDTEDNSVTTPLSRVCLDGSESSDPSGSPLVSYRWEVMASPAGTDPTSFDWESQQSTTASLFAALSGEYQVALIVGNELGRESALTPESMVTFVAVPQDTVYIELYWDDPESDQDLMLSNNNITQDPCSNSHICSFYNRTPSWFSDFETSSGPNPSLIHDDATGFGPEVITIQDPAPGSYSIYIHDYPIVSAPPTPRQSTVRIYINGELNFEKSLSYETPNIVWPAVDMNWSESEDGIMQVQFDECPPTENACSIYENVISPDEDC